MKFDNVDLTNVAVRVSQYPTDNKPEFLILGRSNVGKSSFINTLVNRKNLARTSATPGKTQTLNFYFINESFYYEDTNILKEYVDEINLQLVVNLVKLKHLIFII